MNTIEFREKQIYFAFGVPLIHKHHNRILAVIRNRKNKSIHLQPIRNMVDNFDKMFPFSFQLSNNLLKEYFKLQNRVL